MDTLDLTYVTGTVMGEEASSGVDGILLEGVFYGNVYSGNRVFFVDPIEAANQSYTTFNDAITAVRDASKSRI